MKAATSPACSPPPRRRPTSSATSPPFRFPEVFQGINAYTLGARAVNLNIEVRVVWTSSWYDPGKEADATKALIGMKADVITHHTNSTAVASTCEEAKVPVISYNSAMHKAAPTMLLGGVVHRWEEYYTNGNPEGA